MLSKYGNCTCHCFYKSVKVEKNSRYFVGIKKKNKYSTRACCRIWDDYSQFRTIFLCASSAIHHLVYPTHTCGRLCKFIKLSEVGGGRVSLSSYVLLWSFTSWKLRSFLEQIFLLLFRQPCVQFGLQATRPLKDYPRNSAISHNWPQIASDRTIWGKSHNS